MVSVSTSSEREDLMSSIEHGHSHASSPLPSGARADCDTPERVEEMRLDERYCRANGMLGSDLNLHLG